MSRRQRVSGRRRRRAALAAALAAALTAVLSLAAPVPAGAATEGWLAAAAELLEQRRRAPVLSLNDAASLAQNRFGGQVISIAPAEEDGRRGYRVKVLLDSGRVKTLFVEARTGAVIDRREREP